MMSYLYPEDEVTFDKSGFGPLPDMLESYAEEEANSYFELYFEYPLFSSHERGDYNQFYVNMSDYLIEGNQVTYKPSHSREAHAFRIYRTEKQVERGIILVWARTRTADLRGNPVRKVVSKGAPVSSALRALKLASEETHPFSFTTNIQSNISFEKTQTNVLDALAGEEESILAITGGQMIRTNNNIYIGINESSKNIVEFRLGKNIEGISYEVDYSNVVTAVIPFYTQTYKLVDNIRDEIVRDGSGKIVKNADGTTKYNRTVGKKRESLDKEVIVYGDTVFSQYANDYSTPFYSFVEIRDDREDVGVDKDPLPPFTKADINSRAVNWFDWEENLGVDEPEVSVKVDVHDISQSSEYSHNVNLAKLETLNVFDKALVYVPEVGIDMDMEINYIRYDGVAEKNLEVRLGTTLTSLTETVLSPQQRAFNERVQQLDREIEKSLMSSDGKSRVYWMATKPTGSFEIGDLWFDITLDGGIYVWDGYDWVPKITSDFAKLVEDSVNAAIDAAETAKQDAINSYDNAVAETERLVGEQTTAFDKKFGNIQDSVDTFNQSVADVDAKADDAIEKAGANANLITTHQNTIANIKKSPEKQITGYQTIKERSDLYERVIGNDEAGIKSNMARMVMTDTLFKAEVIKNVPSAIGGRNYVLKSDEYYYTSNYKVAEYDLSVIPKGTKIKVSLWGALGSTVRTFGIYINNGSGLTSGNSQRFELAKLDGTYGRGRSAGLSKWTAEVTSKVDATKIIVFGFDDNSSTPKRIEYVQIETGDYYTDWTAAPEDKASISAITHLENSIDLKVSDSELISRINVQAGGILITSGTNKLNITPETTYIEDATIKSAMIHSIDVGKITGIEADFTKMVTKGLTANVIKSEHINATVALVNKLFSEDAYVKQLTSKTAFIESIQTINLSASKITTGELDGSKAAITNIDAKNITANQASLVQAGFKSSSGGTLELSGDQILSTASNGSQVFLQNGVTGTRNPDGATVGQIGYTYESSSPWYSMQVSHGSHFQIRMSRGAGELNKQAFYIVSGGTESYLNTDNIYLNPSSAGRVRVQGAMTVDNDLRLESTLLVRSKLEYLNGGFIESQSANSNMVINSTNKMIMYTNGISALEIDSSHAVFRRKISENSDIRLKTNIVDMPISSLDAIRNMEIKKFDYLDGRKNYYGIIAQQAQQYLPELINTDSEGYLMVDKSAMTYINMHAIQQLDSKVDDEVAQLKAQVASLQEGLATLKGDRN